MASASPPWSPDYRSMLQTGITLRVRALGDRYQAITRRWAAICPDLERAPTADLQRLTENVRARDAKLSELVDEMYFIGGACRAITQCLTKDLNETLVLYRLWERGFEVSLQRVQKTLENLEGLDVRANGILYATEKDIKRLQEALEKEQQKKKLNHLIDLRNKKEEELKNVEEEIKKQREEIWS